MKFFICLFITFIIGCTQTRNGNGTHNEIQVGGRCEDCEIMLVDRPSTIPWKTTITPANEPGETLVIHGKIFKQDGISPAPGVVMYLYQTNDDGYYSPGASQNPASKKHGRIRGWVKTNSSGEYAFETIKPGVYPDRSVPAHIHPTIKEDGKSFYYIDDYVFEGEFKVDDAYKSKQERRGGSGIIRITKDSGGVWRGSRNLTLGLNIPDYK